MRKHAGTKCMRARAWATWVLRACGGGPADSMSAFCLVEGRRGGSRRKGAGKGPRPRPATTPVKAHVQLRFDAQRARLVMTRGRVRDMIVKDRADTVRLAHAKV